MVFAVGERSSRLLRAGIMIANIDGVEEEDREQRPGKAEVQVDNSLTPRVKSPCVVKSLTVQFSLKAY